MSPLPNSNTIRTPSPKNASEVRTFASDFRTHLEKVSITSKFLTACNRTQIPACSTQNFLRWSFFIIFVLKSVRGWSASTQYQTTSL